MALVFDSVNGFRDTGTGALTLPSGTTAQRPQSPAYGMMRYNTDNAIIESYGQTANGVGWSVFTNGTFQAEVLMVRRAVGVAELELDRPVGLVRQNAGVGVNGA